MKYRDQGEAARIPEGQSVLVARVKIKPGTLVFQDHHVGRWPATASGEEIDVNTIFLGEWNGRWWDCRTDGHGVRTFLGEKGRYGNGSFLVSGGYESVEIVEEKPSTSPPECE